MNVLILGATGFIGHAVFLSLVSKHRVTIAGRTPLEGYDNWKHLDFSEEADWDRLIAGIDLVINAIGIIEGDFERVQTLGPIAFFNACIKREVSILNISAVGAEKEHPPTRFLQSKKLTDNFLLKYDRARIIYPGIVIGRNGKSSQFFAALAGLPVIPLVKSDSPFIHITQLCELVKEVVDDFDRFEKQIFAVSERETLKDVILAMNGGKGRFVNIPTGMMTLFFNLFPKASFGIMNKDTLALQSVISSGDYQPRFGKASDKIIPGAQIKSSAIVEALAVLALMFIWVWSGVSSLISLDTSYALMHEIGAEGWVATACILLGSGADIILGIALYRRSLRRPVLVSQILLLLIYMMILTLFAPHYWVHPLGILSKNIPLLALSYYLLFRESGKK